MTVLLSPVGGVAAQFFDNNGNPLSGGKLFSYAAGTTTPAATYTSSLGVTAHTNPIVLDSGGRVPGGEIWLTDGVIYKFVLQTSTNVLIATYDNIVGINSNFVNYTTEQEIQTATAGQTVFNLTTTEYQPGTNSLTVYVDGVNQYGPGAQYAYLETDSNTVTFVSGLHVGASVKFTTATQTTGNATDASVVSYTPPFTGGVTTNVEARLAQYVSVKDFGAVGDGVTDDTAAIQAAITSAQASPQYQSYNPAITGGGVFGGYMGRIYFPKGTYLISNTITVTSSYLDIDFGNSVLLKSGSFPANAFAFDCTNSWVGRVTDGTFFNFPKVFKLYNPNLNTGRLDFTKLDIYGSDVAFDIECRSTFTSVANCRFLSVKQIAIIRSGDQVSFKDGWIEAGVIAADYGAHFEFVSPGNAPGLELIDMVYVPTPQTVIKPSIVKVGINNCRVTIERGFYGAEPGAIPLIASYANASASVDRGSQYTISNVMVYSSSGVSPVPMVRLYALPNSIVFSNVYGFIEQTHVESLIFFDTTIQSFAAADAARLGRFEIFFVGRQINNFDGLPLANRNTLNKFVRSTSPTSYGYALGTTNVVSYSIPINSFNFPGEFRRGNIYRISISNPGNPGADRYSEYIVQADFAGTGVTIAPVIEGTSIAASRLSTTGSNLLILTNGFDASTDFVYSIVKLADSTEGY
jgi:hypothetical protein